MRVAGTTAVISGGASGIGRATAQRLVADGANVVLLDLPSSDGARVAAELGDAARFAAADVTSAAEVEAAVELALDTFGAVHVAVSCAGIGPPGRTVGRDGAPLALERFERIVAVNLVGTYNLIRTAAAAMCRRDAEGEEERGVIVNTASIAAYDGQIGQAAYAASKAGVVGLTLPVARDLASRRIRCMTIAPGTIDTPLLDTISDEFRAALAAAIPHPSRLGRPEEFAQLVAHVVENPLLNGETIRLDGALRMAPR